MSLAQLIYTSRCVAGLTPELSYEISVKSVEVCEQLGLTGRVFANETQAFAMTEGPSDLVRQYYEAIKADSRVETIVLHLDRTITVREFEDYSVWLNLDQDFPHHPQVLPLTQETVGRALPSALSSKLRILSTVYLNENMVAAA